MTKDSKNSDFKPCCQTGDKVCGKLKRAESAKIRTAPKNTQANIKKDNKEWVYTNTVRDHFFNPRNLLTPDEEASFEADGVGEVGSPACGDVMKVWIRVDEKTKRIKECKWQTFGCGSAISSTSIMSEMVTENGGMTIDEALALKAMDINERLGGLPNIKIHCSILGDQALKKAIEDYLGRA